MPLGVILKKVQPAVVFNASMSSDMEAMAREAGIYDELWHPEKLGITKAADLVEPLRKGLAVLRLHPERFQNNRMGKTGPMYAGFVAWVFRYLEACEQSPDADIEVVV